MRHTWLCLVVHFNKVAMLLNFYSLIKLWILSSISLQLRIGKLPQLLVDDRGVPEVIAATTDEEDNGLLAPFLLIGCCCCCRNTCP